MDNGGARLVNNLATGPADAVTKIRVLAIGGGECGIETTEARKQLSIDHQTCARAIADLARKVVARAIRIIPKADHFCGTVFLDPRSRFLKPHIRKYEPATNHPGLGNRVESAQHLGERTGLHLGVIVEEQQIALGGERGAAVASGNETLVGL